jgi:parallel beta-helix repeat protein
VHWFSGLLSLATEYENNGANGLELSALNGCPGARIEASNDFGGNSASGLRIGSGLYRGGQSNSEMFIMGNQWGNNNNHDLYITGWDSTNSHIAARAITILGNQFIGLVNSAATNTYDAIHVEDSAANTIEGNTINSSQPSGATYRYGIREIQNSGHKLGVDEIDGNYFHASVSGLNFGTGSFLSDNTNTGFSANNEVGSPTRLFSNPYFQNNTWLRWKDSGGTQQNILELGASNNVYLAGHPTQKAILFQPNPGTTTVQMTATSTIGPNLPILASLMTTAATSDNVTLRGMTSSGHCQLTATNASASKATGTYVSNKTADQITVTHAPTRGMRYDVLCTSN